MAYPADGGDSLFDSWMASAQKQDLCLAILTSTFSVALGNMTGRQNYMFRVTRTNCLHFLREARKCSDTVNTLLAEVPFIPNPEYWAYSSPIDPRSTTW